MGRLDKSTEVNPATITHGLQESSAVTDWASEKGTEIRSPCCRPMIADIQARHCSTNLAHIGMDGLVFGVLDRKNTQMDAQSFQCDDLVQDKGL